MAKRRRSSRWNYLGHVIRGVVWDSAVYSRYLLLPHSNSNIRKTLILAGIMWFVLFLVLALKYPANPPAVGDPEIICYRESLYIRTELEKT
jgi:Probable cobalt transporter subunit (CbtA)